MRFAGWGASAGPSDAATTPRRPTDSGSRTAVTDVPEDARKPNAVAVPRIVTPSVNRDVPLERVHLRVRPRVYPRSPGMHLLMERGLFLGRVLGPRALLPLKILPTCLVRRQRGQEALGGSSGYVALEHAVVVGIGTMPASSQAHMTLPGCAKGGPREEPPPDAGSDDQRLLGERTACPRRRRLC